MKLDDFISAIREVRKTVENSGAYGSDGKETMIRALDLWRSCLMKADLKGFEDLFTEFSGNHPDEYDELVELLYDETGVKDVESLTNLEESLTLKQFIKHSEEL